MTQQFARTFTRLYARTWRERYGDEFEAMLREMPATPQLVVDVIFGAIRSRRTTLAALATAVLLIAFLPLSHGKTANRVAAAPHVRSVQVAAACRTYTSISQTGRTTPRRCLT